MDTQHSLQTLKAKLMNDSHYTEVTRCLFHSMMRDKKLLSQGEETSNQLISAVFADAFKRLRAAPLSDALLLRFPNENFVYGSGFSDTHIGAIGYFEDINLGFVYILSLHTREVLFGKFSLTVPPPRKQLLN